MKKYINEAFLYLLFGVLAFGYFFYIGLIKEKITSSQDLVEIGGKYSTHSFKDNKEFRNFTHQYYIWTDNYKNAFQIKADYRGIFNKEDFTTTVSKGAKVKFNIPMKMVGSLNSEKDIVVTSIVVEGINYLDLNEVLKIENGLASSNTDYFFGVGILIVGLIGFFREKLK